MWKFLNIVLNMINPSNFRFIKDKLINKIGKNKNYFYNHYKNICPAVVWNNNVISYQELINLTLFKQGIFYFSIMHCDFLDEYNNNNYQLEEFAKKITTTSLKNHLRGELYSKIWKTHKVWKKMLKKMKIISKTMSRYKFLSQDSKPYIHHIHPTNYNTFHWDIQIVDHTITLVDSIDLHNQLLTAPESYKPESYSYKNISKQIKQLNKKIFNELKSKEFVFNLKFVSSKNHSKSNHNDCNLGKFKLYFNKRGRLIKLATIFDMRMNGGGANKCFFQESCSIFFVNCLKWIKNAFNVGDLETVLQSGINQCEDAQEIKEQLKTR